MIENVLPFIRHGDVSDVLRQVIASDEARRAQAVIVLEMDADDKLTLSWSTTVPKERIYMLTMALAEMTCP